ncbi:MAG: SDR family oxidoreductase [Alphaproteobacteria bacterium]|nr:SDR family oxidoreductase [Alphaproteobacteria bacterium]
MAAAGATSAKRLSGKVALVTGTAGGIGAAIVARFVAEGASVLAVDIDEAGAARAATGAGAAARSRRCDVTDPEEAAATVAETQRAFGALHILVNGAAALLHEAPVDALDEAVWWRTLDVNLTGAFLMSKHAVPAIARAGGGAIIHIASQLGQVGTPARVAYCASKAGLIQLARCMALDHAHQNIRVNSLSPGAVETGRLLWRHGSMEAARGVAIPKHPLGRLGRPEEIAAAAAYLAGDDAAFMTGADLVVDGGYTAQ